jgi:hypothetical protein
MAFAGVNDEQAGVACCRQNLPAGSDRGKEPLYVVAEGGPEAVGLQEIALHINDDEGGTAQVNPDRMGFGIDSDRHDGGSRFFGRAASGMPAIPQTNAAVSAAWRAPRSGVLHAIHHLCLRFNRWPARGEASDPAQGANPAGFNAIGQQCVMAWRLP